MQDIHARRVYMAPRASRPMKDSLRACGTLPRCTIAHVSCRELPAELHAHLALTAPCPIWACPVLAALLHPHTSAEFELLYKTKAHLACLPARLVAKVTLTCCARPKMRAAQDSCKPVRAHGDHRTMHSVPCPATPQLQRLLHVEDMRTLPSLPAASCVARYLGFTPRTAQLKSAFAPQCACAPCMHIEKRPCRQALAAPAELTPRQLHMRVLKSRRVPGKWYREPFYIWYPALLHPRTHCQLQSLPA